MNYVCVKNVLKMDKKEESFNELKEEISSPRVLALYDTSARTKTSADASAYELGAVLLQQHQDKWCPVTFASLP